MRAAALRQKDESNVPIRRELASAKHPWRNGGLEKKDVSVVPQRHSSLMHFNLRDSSHVRFLDFSSFNKELFFTFLISPFFPYIHVSTIYSYLKQR